jgi:hypothetical protein
MPRKALHLLCSPQMNSVLNQTKTADLTIRLRPDLKARLQAAKQRKDRSVAWLVERCIEAYLPVLEQEQPDITIQLPRRGRSSNSQGLAPKGRLPAVRKRKSAPD